MEHFICTRCGTQYPASLHPPAQCAICADEREAIAADGQQWTTQTDLRGYCNRVITIDAEITGIVTEPSFAIAQQAYLIRTAQGNVLWDCLSVLDDATIAAVGRLGGVRAMALSHPHFFSAMVDWSHAFNAPIVLHEANRPWVLRPDSAIQYWEGAAHEVVPGVTLVQCGGHFPGSAVLHWAAGAAGRGVLLTGDTITVAADRRWVSGMYSYVNDIPLGARAVRRIAAAVAPYPFERLYGGWPGHVVAADAKGAVARSVARYLSHLR